MFPKIEYLALAKSPAKCPLKQIFIYTFDKINIQSKFLYNIKQNGNHYKTLVYDSISNMYISKIIFVFLLSYLSKTCL